MPQNRLEPQGVFPPTGQYSHAVRASGTLLFIAGQVAMNKEGRVVGAGDIAAQCDQVFQNLSAILSAAGATFANVVKMNTYIVDMRGADAVRSARASYMGDNRPASTFVGVASLANPQYLVEIEAVAVLE